MYVGYGYDPRQVQGGAFAYAGPNGAGAGAYAAYQQQAGVSQQVLGSGSWGYGNTFGGVGGYGGSYGMGSATGYYLGQQVTHTQTPVYQDIINRQAVYETVTEKQAVTTTQPNKMWDVWFDHKDGQKTTQRSPIVLDLNNNGKPDITGANVTGNGKIDGATTKFDIDPSKDSYQYKSLQRRPGKGAPKVAGGHWVNKDGRKLYVDKNGEIVGELKKTGKGAREEYQYGKRETKEETEWLAKNGGDGLLVWDVDNNGKIESSKELFGEFDIDGKKKFSNGYEKLAHHFDKNKDGKVEGDELKGLKIWKDSNADGKVDAGELQELSQYNISSFDVKNYDGKTMEGSYSTSTTTYKDVQKTVLTGYKEEHIRQLVGYKDEYQVNTWGGAWGANYGWNNWGGGYGWGNGGWGNGWNCWC